MDKVGGHNTGHCLTWPDTEVQTTDSDTASAHTYDSRPASRLIKHHYVTRVVTIHSESSLYYYDNKNTTLVKF